MKASAGLTSDTVAGSAESLSLRAANEPRDLTPAGHAEAESVSRRQRRRLLRVLRPRVCWRLAGEPVRRNAERPAEPVSVARRDDHLHRAPPTLARSKDSRYIAKRRLVRVRLDQEPDRLRQHDANTGSPTRDLSLQRCLEPARLRVVQPQRRSPDAGRPRRYRSTLNRTLSPTAAGCSSKREALLPRDTNGQVDVYEYENGRLHLISVGHELQRIDVPRRERKRRRRVLPHAQQLVPQDTNRNAARSTTRAWTAASPNPPRRRRARPPMRAVRRLAAALDLRRAVELDVLRRGEPRAALKPSRSRQAQVQAHEVQAGFVKKKGKCVKRAHEKPGSPPTRTEDGQVIMLSRRIATAVSLVAAAIVALAVGASPALAETHRSLSQLRRTRTVPNPNGIAVEESTGDVYVAEIGTNTVYKFDASGNPVELLRAGLQRAEAARRRPARSRSRRRARHPGRDRRR